MKPNFAFLLMLAATFTFVSCSEKDLYNGDPKTYTPADFKMTESYDVVVEEGTAKQVLVNGEVVYDGDMSLTIEIPKVGLATRSGGVQEIVTTASGSDKKTQIYKKGVLFFEDITDGDNDYNDLVCYIDEMIELKKNENMPKYNVEVTPLAMGNQLVLQLGVDLVVNGEVWKSFLLKENKDLKELFYGKGAKGYINTVNGEAHLIGTSFDDKNNKANGTVKEKSKIETNYYIIVEGSDIKRYACDSSNAELTNNKVPFGMFVPGVETFKYAQEFKSFFEAYPNFMNWVDGAKADPFSDPDTSLLY